MAGDKVQLYTLFEHAVGYCLFQVKEFENIGSFLPQVEASITDVSKFKTVVQLVGFRAFKNAASALDNINAVSEGILTKDLSAFLQTNMPSPGTNDKITLGVGDPKLGAAISEVHQYQVTHSGVVPEILRGIRFHLVHFIRGLNAASLKQSELGLGHSYSRGKVKFNVNRADNMIIQSIALVDQLDKDINTFSMRIREWYSYHFPELAKVITDNYQYAVCANFIGNRTSLNDEKVEKLEEITTDSSKAQAVLNAAKMSMGMDISPIDLLNIEIFAKRVANLADYRRKLAEYLRSKMNVVAPNLSTLIGEVVGARLISHAGSLTNLAKCPASTVQILGAEKALFRALKTRGKTPKYGLIFHSPFIGKAAPVNKGRISRYLANKCSLASRIDCFSEVPTNVFGEKLRGQVEERLTFYESGELPRKNIDVMTDAVILNSERIKQIVKREKKKKKQNKDKTENMILNGSGNEDNGRQEENVTNVSKKKKIKKLKETNEIDGTENSLICIKNKKKKQKKRDAMEMEKVVESTLVDKEGGQKKKKKKRSLTEDETEHLDFSLQKTDSKKRQKMQN